MGFKFNIQKWPAPHSSSIPSAKKPHFETQFESYGWQEVIWLLMLVQQILRRKYPMGVSIHDALQCTSPMTMSSLVVQVGTPP